MEELKEELIRTWIELTGIIKNNRIMKSISYNEGIILNYTYKAYQNRQGIYVQEILKRTRMLKSLCNRTINQLAAKGFIYRKQEKNQLRIFFCPEKEEEYMKIHRETMEYIQPILDIWGVEETQNFINSIRKLTGRLS